MGGVIGTTHDSFSFSGGGTETIAIEGLDVHTPGFTCHSGTRCLLMTEQNGQRNEFDINDPDALNINDQLYVSVWLYLPSGWHVTHDPPTLAWYALDDPIKYGGNANAEPFYEMHYDQLQVAGPFILSMWYRNFMNGGVVIQQDPTFTMPTGQWFHVEYYLLRATSNGRLIVWINGIKEFDYTGQTLDGATEAWYTCPAKIYHNPTDTALYELWVDDLSIYNGLPSNMTGSYQTQSNLPASHWYLSGDTAYYSFNSTVTASATKQYAWSLTSGLFQTLQSHSFTVTSGGTVTGTFVTEYAQNLITAAVTTRPSIRAFVAPASLRSEKRADPST